MATCKLCCKKVLSHAKTVACAVCHWKYHLNCISINENELTTILSAPNHWYCMFCMSSSLPFIHIEDELEYEETLSERNKFDLTCESFQEKLFNPFSPKDKELDLPLDDLDPDSNFYNGITYHSSTFCNYYMEDSFKNEIALHSQDQIKPFSLLHLNARSLQSNFKNLQPYLMSLEYEFTAIGVSETWLHDSICDLYNLPGYNFIENHRSHRSGGGVGIYLNKNIEFSIRYDLSEFDNLLESVFIEIQIDAVQSIKNVIIGVIYRPPGTDLWEFNIMPWLNPTKEFWLLTYQIISLYFILMIVLHLMSQMYL